MKYMICSMACIFIQAYILCAQNAPEDDKWLEYLYEFSGEDEESPLPEDIVEELTHIRENPYNLNTVNRKQLENLPFLSAIQIENILYYVYKYGSMQTIYELKNIEGLDRQTIEYLLPFVYAGEPAQPKTVFNLKDAFSKARQEVVIRTDRCFQQKAGYKLHTQQEFESSPNHYYLGEEYYLSVKYNFNYKDRITFGFAGEKDAGEAFWTDDHKGFDYYSFHFIWKGTGILNSLYAGDFKASFGQGLILNSGFMTGKTSSTIAVARKGTGLRKHFSTNEIDYFRGAAISLAFNDFQLHLFQSFRKTDATTEENYIRSFKTDGYNRTVKDLEKKRKASVNLTGLHAEWERNYFHIGFTAVYQDFGGKILFPDIKPYNIWYLRGKNNYNAGVNYGYVNKFFSFQGEVAGSKSGGTAFLNTLQWYPVSNATITLIHRHYQKNYHATYGKAFGESSGIQNESGIYIGLNYKFMKYYELTAYSDHFRFPWLKYGIDLPSYGTDRFAQLTYKRKYNWDMKLQLRVKNKFRNDNSGNSFLPTIIPYRQNKWRYQFNYQFKNGMQLRMQSDFSRFAQQGKELADGGMVSGNLRIPSPKLSLQTDIGIAGFYTDDWNTRITVYEKNILYAYSFPSFSGQGMRLYSVFKLNFRKECTLYLKLAATRYFDREEIGTGPETIEGNIRMDSHLLLRYKF